MGELLPSPLLLFVTEIGLPSSAIILLYLVVPDKWCSKCYEGRSYIIILLRKSIREYNSRVITEVQ